eukprot:3575458-Prymnesium_polylepis.1
MSKRRIGRLEPPCKASSQRRRKHQTGLAVLRRASKCDRALTGAWRQGEALLPVHEGAAEVGLHRNAVEAVSYTHLRAHETLMNL